MTGIDTEIDVREARRLQLRAQGLLGAAGRRTGVEGVLRRLGAVQLDTISVLARSHELVPYARLGAVGRGAVEAAYWAGGHAFEYWAHAACVLPITEWPYFGFRRRDFLRRGRRWHQVPEALCGEILRRLRTEGPLTTRDLGGARAGRDGAPESDGRTEAGWWDWSGHKIAIEWLLDIGEVVCVRRDAWRRVYDLPERVIPPEILAQDPDDATCLTRLVRHAGRALGVATRADLADYYRLKNHQVDSVIEATGLVPVRLAGQGGRAGASGSQRAWADPQSLDGPARGRHVATLLSPFDSLVWDRARASRMFGFDHRLEAYVPRAKRVHGYFAMPLLAGGRLIGRVDPARDNGTLIARRVSFVPGAVSGAARTDAAMTALGEALWGAAGWVGADDVRVEVIDPPELAEPIHRALRATRPS